MIQIPNMLLIGGADRNAGKTRFACRVIETFRPRFDLVAVKATVIRNEPATCPRGGKGCGVCTSLAENFEITEEANSETGKDTANMLKAGARRVFWLRVREDHLAPAVRALRETIGRDTLSVCESNSLRRAVEPGLFVMVKSRDGVSCKSSARAVEAFVDWAVSFHNDDYDFDFNRLGVVGGRWVLRLPAAAVILAGGKSSRMGEDKSLLAIRGRPMVEHIALQLQPHFDQVLLSTDNSLKYAFLNLPIVPDPVAGQGPLMGIAAALEASASELNVFIACDIPDINMPFVRRMLSEAAGYDAVVPVTADDEIEPLFAVYRTTMLPSIRRCLQSGKRRIRDAFDQCKIKYVKLENNRWLKNLNTKEDYDAYRKMER